MNHAPALSRCTLPDAQRFGTAGIVVLAAFATILGGCSSMGPSTVGRDRLDYDHSVAESWKKQLLLNVVKLRYGDVPLFLDVASITNSYGLETQVGAAVGWADVVGIGANDVQNLQASTRYSDKPTITYSPMTGNRFTKSLMTPVSPAVVISLIQAGWAADAVMKLMVTSVNGVQNRFAAGGRARGADPEFYRLVAAIRRIQQAGAVGMKMERTKDADPQIAVLVLTPGGGREEAAVDQDRREVGEILKLRPDLQEIRITFGSGPGKDDEIAMITRSMLEMLFDLSASAVEVPPVHLEQGRAPKTRAFDSDPEGGYRPMILIHSAASEPPEAFVSVAYRNHWFWIDDCDFPSKSLFTFMLIMSSLTESEPAKGAPVITIPAG